jgi:hypothetical protein
VVVVLALLPKCSRMSIPIIFLLLALLPNTILLVAQNGTGEW